MEALISAANIGQIHSSKTKEDWDKLDWSAMQKWKCLTQLQEKKTYLKKKNNWNHNRFPEFCSQILSQCCLNLCVQDECLNFGFLYTFKLMDPPCYSTSPFWPTFHTATHCYGGCAQDKQQAWWEKLKKLGNSGWPWMWYGFSILMCNRHTSRHVDATSRRVTRTELPW